MTATSGGGSVLLLTASACWPPDPVIITAAASLIMIWDAIQPTPRCSPRSNDVSREPQKLGQRVLIVDLDPQACLTFSVGYDPESIGCSVHQVLDGQAAAQDALLETD